VPVDNRHKTDIAGCFVFGNAENLQVIGTVLPGVLALVLAHGAAADLDRSDRPGRSGREANHLDAAALGSRGVRCRPRWKSCSAGTRGQDAEDAIGPGSSQRACA